MTIPVANDIDTLFPLVGVKFHSVSAKWQLQRVRASSRVTLRTREFFQADVSFRIFRAEFLTGKPAVPSDPMGISLARIAIPRGAR